MRWLSGRFELGTRAGSGGMGTVHRARDVESGAVVALKLFPPLSDAGLRRFDREAAALARVVHPAIVRYVAHGRDEARAFIAMEWLEGETLRDRLARAPLAIDEAVRVVRRVAEGVAAAHRAGILHRDLKPSNVFLVAPAGSQHGSADDARLIDFGLARAIEGEQDHELTHQGALLGTVGYMAPEQARSPRDVDARADVFGLAAVLYRCVVGERPFRGRDEAEALVQTMFEDVPDARALAPDVPRALSQLLGRALARDPAQRPESASAFAAALAEVAEGLERGVVAAVPFDREQRIVCSVLVHGPIGALAEGIVDPPEAARVSAIVQRVAVRHQLALEAGRLVVPREGTASDRAARAARCALELHAELPSLALSVVARRDAERTTSPSAQALAMQRTHARGVGVDETIAGLLDARFEIESDRTGLTLRGEGVVSPGTRTLLGRPTPCVGRERELAFLVSLYDESAGEKVARAAVVIAPPGIGKSRLRYELVRRIEARNEASIWIARGDPMREGSPFAIAGDALRPLFDIGPEDDDVARRRKIGARVSRLFEPSPGEAQRVADFVAELLRTPGERTSSTTNVKLQAARRSPILMADQITRAFAELVAAECARAPVVLVIEDLHWGDAPSIALVDAALRACRDLPFLVLAFARPELRERRPSLWADRGAVELALPELGRRAAERLARSVLGDDAEEQTLARIVDQAGGNAFFLEELIRAVAEGRRADLPHSVVAMAESRLEALEPDARRVLRAASVFGQVFHAGGVGALVQPLDPQPWLEELVRREFVSRRATSRLSGQDELVFRHAFVREAAYALLLPEDRALGHRLAGEWLERAGESDARMLADHFARGGERARAAVHHRRAATQALAANDLALAQGEAERAIAAGAHGEDFVVAATVLAEVLGWAGDSRAAERWALEGLARATPGAGSWCEAAAECAGAAGRYGNVVRLLWLADQLRAALRDQAAIDARAFVHAATKTGVQLLMSGCYDPGAAMLDRAEELAEPLLARDPWVELRVLSARAFRTHLDGNPNAVRISQQAAEAALRAGDLRARCVLLMNVGVGALEIAALELSESVLREALGDATRLGLGNIVAAARNNLGWTLGCAGRLDEARAELTEAIRELESGGDKRMLGGAHTRMARVLLLAGELQLAEVHAARAVALLEAARPLRAQALAVLARARLAQGRIDDAWSAAESAQRLLDELGKLDEGEALVLLTVVEVLRAKGDSEGAEAARRRGRMRLLARAERLDDERVRQAFLHLVPEHAALVAV